MQLNCLILNWRWNAGEHRAGMAALSPELLGEVAAGPFPSRALASPGRSMQNPPLLSAGNFFLQVWAPLMKRWHRQLCRFRKDLELRLRRRILEVLCSCSKVIPCWMWVLEMTWKGRECPCCSCLLPVAFSVLGRGWVNELTMLQKVSWAFQFEFSMCSVPHSVFLC